jgi:hypothetical protein
MKRLAICAIVALSISRYATGGTASTITINPVDDGWTNRNSVLIRTDYVVVSSGGQRGVIKFSTSQITNSITQAFFSVNPYGLPLRVNSIDVYGYQSNNAQITSSEYNDGVFLGNLVVPANLSYGQDAFLDVTQFVQGVSSPFVRFNLRTPAGASSGDIFSSLEYNFGHPSQLTVTLTPEPCTIVLFGLGGLLLGRRKK